MTTQDKEAVEEVVAVSVCNGRWETIVDKETLTRFGDWKWSVTYSDRRRKHPYCVIHRTINKRFIKLRLHREIVGAPKSAIVDHINGDTLDNRRSNLRIVTNTANAQNIRKFREKKTSKYLGVHLDLKSGKWSASATSQILKRRINLGYFESESLAALKRDLYVFEHYTDAATTNFPRDIIAIIYKAEWQKQREKPVNGELNGDD